MLQRCMCLCMTCTTTRSPTHAQARVRSLATSPTASVTSLSVLPAVQTRYHMSHSIHIEPISGNAELNNCGSCSCLLDIDSDLDTDHVVEDRLCQELSHSRSRLHDKRGFILCICLAGIRHSGYT